MDGTLGLACYENLALITFAMYGLLKMSVIRLFLFLLDIVHTTFGTKINREIVGITVRTNSVPQFFCGILSVLNLSGK